MKVYLLVWAAYCGSTDAASLLGAFSTKEKAEEARALQYDLGYHGKANGTEEGVDIIEADLDVPLLEATRLI